MNSPKTSAMAIKRRDFFKMGGISLGAISPLGLSLPEVLANEAASDGKKQINVIFMFLQGGASHLDMYDLKPDAPQEIRGNYKPARTNWLIGMREYKANLFQDINWSTETVFEETVIRAKQENLPVHLLRELSDIDTEADWKEWSG